MFAWGGKSMLYHIGQLEAGACTGELLRQEIVGKAGQRPGDRKAARLFARKIIEVLEVGIEIGLLHDAEPFLENIPVAVDQQCEGQATLGVAERLHQRNALGPGDEYRVIHLVSLGEFPGRFSLVLDADTEDFEFALVDIADGDQFGNFGTARAAPAGPEIDDQRLALVALERHWFVVEVVQCGREQRNGGWHLLRYGERRK